MAEDHLGKEVSISVEINDKGIKAGAKSRFIAAIDNFVGNFMDLASAHVEAHTHRRRARTDGEVNIINEITRYGVEKFGANPALAERAFERHYSKILNQQENLDHVLKSALDDLTETPPDEASAANDTPLSEEFLDRLGNYASAASTEDLRKRWGRVLAAEVRTPGTFSVKVLRVVDELDAVTAGQFEKIARHRIGSVLPTILAPEMDVALKIKLTSAGLLVEPGITGHVLNFAEIQDYQDAKIKLMGFHDVGAVSFSGTPDIEIKDENQSALAVNNGAFGIPCYFLTDAGAAIASILPNQQFDALTRYAQKLSESKNLNWVMLYVPDGAGNFVPVSYLPGNPHTS